MWSSTSWCNYNFCGRTLLPFLLHNHLAYHGSCIPRHNATNRQGKRNADGEIRRVYEAYTRHAHMPYSIETVKEMDRRIKEECGCVCVSEEERRTNQNQRAESARREHETEARENSIVDVYTAFTDQVITHNASRAFSLSPSLSFGLRTSRNAFNINHLRTRYGTLSYGRPPRK